MDKFSYIGNAEPQYIESLYQEYKTNPESIDIEWKKFFEGFDFASVNSSNGKTSLADHAEFDSASEFKVYNLILSYREKGHLIAKTNPLKPRKDRNAQLQLQQLGFSDAHLEQHFYAGVFAGMENATLQEIIDHLEDCYCKSLGYEYDYIIDPEEKKWFQNKIEQEGKNISLPDEKKKRILKKLNETTIFEQFLEKKYIGQKRFSLEGGETTIAALDAIINKGAEMGVEEFVFAMAHRGRLNVLANILGKTYEQIFNEFEGKFIPDSTMGDGDVKYHLGYSSQVETATNKIAQLKLMPNPSHLEAVDPVSQGFVRAKADVMYKEDWDKILAVTIHGDAAVAGLGVVYEILQMSKLKGYQVGGTLHFVINNQVGFTTDFDDARSSNYCTGYAATVQAPVIHVNGDDAEAVVFAVELAVEYRQQFNKDIFVDMVCYRKHGHNEGDDPKYTQPALYKLIEGRKNPREIYIEKLKNSNEIDQQIADEMEKEFWGELQQRLDLVKQEALRYAYQPPEESWRKLRKNIEQKDFFTSPETKVSKKNLQQIFDNIFKVPEGFTLLKKVEKLFEASKALIEKGKVDWALAELSAYGTILLDGKDVRLSGQDTKRGTFSHRHSTVMDAQTNKEHNRLSFLSDKQGKFRVFNSPLNEFAAMGFEFGYSMASPDNLVLWEAQFGDFDNGAQTIIDQFISASLTKWQRMSGLVLLLPHGYEGQGPEHSSARLERFLQLCAELNMVVANVTTPANFFHILRRQLAWDFRRPLIIMSPKSLLRHPLLQSDIKELSDGKFKELIADDFADNKKVKRVLICSGKIYYDLLEYQQKNNRKDVAIIRIEQLYPFPLWQFENEIKKYPEAEICWVQEEPRNMGSWFYIWNLLGNRITHKISRKSSASPATGFAKVHAQEQNAIVEEAFK
ncbi:MAG: 2-oxoglutarate dehydrogenase E1 component [Fimbriimonadaceae bacterium]|nr:2-oxoglutarate dehydrogenase E1 component [Chitinophagales bacterium]